MKSDFALLRVAGLSVTEASRHAFGADRLDEPFVERAVGLAAGPALLGLSESRTRAREAVARYVQRMGARATPFGLLAGTALIGLGDGSPLTLATPDSHRAYVRIDTGALEAVLASFGVPAPELLRPGREPVAIATDALRGHGHGAAAEALQQLSAAVCGIRALDEVGIEVLARAWERAQTVLPALEAVDERDRFHLDLDLAMASGDLDASLVAELDAALRRLELLFPSADPLAAFAESFRARYEDAEVPLGEALAFRNGLLEATFRAGSPLADAAGVSIAGGRPSGDARVPAAALRAYDHWLTAGLPYDITPLPAARQHSAGSVQAALLDPHVSPFAALLVCGRRRAPLAHVARFALSRPEREQILRDWQAGRQERGSGTETAGPLHVEILHSPGGRMGNILLRPLLHEEAVALTGASGGTMALDRILITLSGGRFFLRDAETGRPVVLALNSAHTTDLPGNDPLYRLLAHLGGSGSITWRWGALAELSHLPRITCGRVIVRAEQWRLTGGQVEQALADRHPGARLRSLLPGLDDRAWVGHGPAGRLMPVNLDSTESVRIMLKRAARRTSVVFTELPQVESPGVCGPGGRHVAEICVPLQRPRPPRPARAPSRRESGFGTEWVYARFYCGLATADSVVLHSHSLAGELRASGEVDQWFFVRFGEGGHHLRVRMRPTAPGNRPAVLAALDALGRQLRTSGLVARTVIDDYVPEVTRYGGPAPLRRAVSLFCADSDEVSSLLRRQPSELARLFYVVANVLTWSDVFLADDDDTIVAALRGDASPGRRAVRPGNRYGGFFREHRKELDACLSKFSPAPQTLARLRELRGELQKQSPPGNTVAVLRAVLHMHCNRVFTVDAQRLERLAHDLAVRKVLERRARAGHRDDHPRNDENGEP